MKNLLSVDVELWEHRDQLKGRIDSLEDIKALHSSIEKILGLFAKYNQKATFFVLGEIAERFPDLISSISRAGHEIGSHGWCHVRVDRMSESAFRSDLQRSRNAIKAAIGIYPVGFRAPQFSFPRGVSWPIKCLLDYGFEYDSSVFPSRTPLYGVEAAETTPYHPSVDDIYQRGSSVDFIEFPLLSTDLFGQRIPASGGFWLRFLGAGFVKGAVEKMNSSGAPAVIYLHNWEIEKISLRGWVPRDVYVNWGIPLTNNLESLLATVEFSSGIEISNDIN